MGEKIRCFIAADIGEDIRARLKSAQDELKKSRDDIKWVRPRGIHLTLKFLGNVDSGIIQGIVEAVKVKCLSHEPFVLRVRGIGCFPGVKRPRVIWAGAEDPEGRLRSLQQDVVLSLVPLGFEKEGRPFRGHLTLGRVRRGRIGQGLRGMIEERSEFEFGILHFDKLILFRSELRPEGARYTVLERIPLMGQ